MPRILVVEDDPSTLQILEQALRDEGYQVDTERSGETAIRAFSASPANAVVLDVLLPGISGFQVAEQIRRMPAGQAVPIIMVSGIYRGQHRHQAAKRFSLLSYVEKPFALDDVLAPLRGALDNGAAGNVASPSPARQPLILRGKLTERALPWVFGELIRRGATGSLFIRSGAERRMIHFRHGVPVLVRSNVLTESVISILVRETMLSPAQAAGVRAAHAGQVKLMADLLIELGLAAPNHLRFAQERQLQTRLSSAFAMEDAEYFFAERSRPESMHPLVGTPPATLLYHAIRRGMGTLALSRELAPLLDRRPALADGAQAWLQQLPAREGRYLEKLDGSRSVRQIVAERSLDDIAALLLTTMSVGIIVPASSQPRNPTRSAPPQAHRPASPQAAPASPQAHRPASPPPPQRTRTNPPAPRSPPTAEEVELRRQFESLEGKTHYEVLGVGRGATSTEMRKAFHRLAKDYHPDRYAKAHPGLRDAADKIFARIASAYKTLGTKSDRDRYDAELAAGASAAEAEAKMTRILNAEQAFREGQLELKRRRYTKALKKFDQSVELYPDEGEYHAYLGHARSLAYPKDPNALERALREIQEGRRLDPKSVKAAHFEGLFHKSAGRTRKAEAAFNDVLDLEPNDIDAARELRLIRMRANKR